MKNNTFETLIGAFVVVIAGLFIFLSIKVSDSRQKLASGYKIIAKFNNIDGINIGSDVKISGMKIGNVTDMKFDNKNYKSLLVIKIPNNIKIPVDSIFKVSTSGLIGSKFINVKIGSEEEYFKNDETAEFTESTMDLEDLISRFIFNSDSKNEKNK